MSEVSAEDRQSIIDAEHLKLLAIFHYVLGGTVILFASFALFYLAFGIILVFYPVPFPPAPQAPNAGVNRLFGYFIAGIGALGLVFGWSLGGLILYAGRSIALRRNRLLCLIVAGLECFWAPFGTVLGVCTFLVLFRDSVRKLYGE